MTYLVGACYGLLPKNLCWDLERHVSVSLFLYCLLNSPILIGSVYKIPLWCLWHPPPPSSPIMVPQPFYCLDQLHMYFAPHGNWFNHFTAWVNHFACLGQLCILPLMPLGSTILPACHLVAVLSLLCAEKGNVCFCTGIECALLLQELMNKKEKLQADIRRETELIDHYKVREGSGHLIHRNSVVLSPWALCTYP